MSTDDIADWLTQEPRPRVVAREEARAGGELALRRAGDDYEVISNGVFLMDTRGGVSERELVRAPLSALSGRAGIRVLVGGLGVGFSAREALDEPRVARVRVVELEPAVLRWHHGPLADIAGNLPQEPHCELVCADVLDHLAAVASAGEVFDAVCMDVDNGPDWTVTEDNGRLYQPQGLELVRRVLAPKGVVSWWCAAPAPGFAASLRSRFGEVTTVEMPVARGEPDVIYTART